MTFTKITYLTNRLMEQLELLRMRHKTRRQLLNLDVHLLKDLGVSQQQALKEGSRYFWQGNHKMHDATANQKRLNRNTHHPQKQRKWLHNS